MKEALNLLNELTDADIDWIMESGTQQKITAGTPIITEGREPDHLYFVLEGLAGVYAPPFGEKEVSTLGAGELLGEISFIEGCPATATVKGMEDTLLLSLSRRQLEEKTNRDPAFAARLYKAFAFIISKRLRRHVSSLEQLLREKERTLDQTPPGAWTSLSEYVEQFKKAVSNADREAINNNDTVPQELEKHVKESFRQLNRALHQCIGEDSRTGGAALEALRQRAQHEILPYVLLTSTFERIYSKPRGYAGDYLTIKKVYDNRPEGVGRLGALLDSCFLDISASKAVRSRKGLFTRDILEKVEENAASPTQVMCMSCGPATEIFDAYEKLDKVSRLKCTLIDIDYQALALVADNIQEKGLKNQCRLENGNLLFLALGRQKLNIPPQDLVYSIGLIDYFNDKFVIKLLNYVHGLLKPGGKVILGNFHPKNPDRTMMDHILDWKLIYRTEEDMNRLFAASAFGRSCTEIKYEEEGINLFAHGVKEA